MMSSILRVSCFPGPFLTFFLLLFAFPGFYFSVIFSWISFYRMFLAGGWKITCCFSSLGTPADSAGNSNRTMMIMMMMMMMMMMIIYNGGVSVCLSVWNEKVTTSWARPAEGWPGPSDIMVMMRILTSI